LIYVAQKDKYLHSQAELSNGTGISNALANGAIIPFEAGKKYKIRVINMSALASEFRSMTIHCKG
jgi:iron transport multicopper oxidase